MSGIVERLREGVGHAWDEVMEGWRRLYERAAGALTRFRSRDAAAPGSGTGWGLLAAEVLEQGDRLVVRVEAPGMEPEDFEIDVVDDHLVIAGEKRYRREADEGRFHVVETAYGRFERVIPLPEPVDVEGAKAKYRRGVLRVELPLARAAKRRRIEIRAG